MTSRKAVKMAIVAKDYIGFKRCLEENMSLVNDEYVVVATKNSGDRMLSSILALMMAPKGETVNGDNEFLKNRRKKFMKESNNISHDRIQSRRRSP